MSVSLANQKLASELDRGRPLAGRNCMSPIDRRSRIDRGPRRPRGAFPSGTPHSWAPTIADILVS
jgi:hypothetical protein